MYCAIRKSVPEPIKTAENAQMAKRKDRNTSRNIYLSRIRIFRRIYSPSLMQNRIQFILSFSNALDKDTKRASAEALQKAFSD